MNNYCSVLLGLSFYVVTNQAELILIQTIHGRMQHYLSDHHTEISALCSYVLRQPETTHIYKIVRKILTIYHLAGLRVAFHRAR